MAKITKSINASVSVALTTPILILPENSGRLAATICNTAASGTYLYLNFQGSITGVGAQGVALNGGSTYQISESNLWTGSVYGYGSAALTATTLDQE